MPPRVGEILVRNGACNAGAIQEALQNQVIFGGRLGTNLLEIAEVKEADLAEALGVQYGVPALFGDLHLAPEAVRLLRPDLADRHGVVPYVLADRRLAVLACDPSDLGMLDEVAFATGRQLHAMVVPEARIWALLKKAYGIDRQLRGIEVDFAAVRARRPGGPVPTPAPTQAPAGDLMDEAEFDALYAKVAGGAPREAPPAPPDEDVLELTAADEVTDPEPPLPPPLVLETLANRPGHAPPLRFMPVARPADEHEPSPLAFAEAERFLEGVDEREAIARTVLRYARSKFKRAVLFTVNRGVARGWAGLGEGISRDRVARMRLELGAPGVVDTVVRTRAHYLGPLPKTEPNVRLLKQLGGGVPRNALLVPILALGRVVNVFYADAGRGAEVDAGGVGELLILATRIAHGYDTLVARRLR